jgi:hypothetical protein
MLLEEYLLDKSGNPLHQTEYPDLDADFVDNMAIIDVLALTNPTNVLSLMLMIGVIGPKLEYVNHQKGIYPLIKNFFISTNV